MKLILRLHARRLDRGRQAAAIHSTIALDQQFEHELEVFRTESETAAQFFYAFLAIHASAGPDKSVHRLLNTAPLFWNTVRAVCRPRPSWPGACVRSEIDAQRRPAAEACAGQPADILKGRARPAKAGDGERTAK
jgi:hypothetical protein